MGDTATDGRRSDSGQPSSSQNAPDGEQRASVSGPDAQRAVDAALSAARQRGVHIALSGPAAEITFDGGHLECPWAWLPKGAQLPPTGHVLDGYRTGTLLLADRITGSRARQARERGLCFADATGRLYLRGAGVLVDVDGRESPIGIDPAGQGSPRDLTPDSRLRATASTGGRPASPARSQVIFALLAWPDLLTASVRSLARISGVSVGVTQEVLTFLRQDGFLTSDRRHLLQERELLSSWTAAFARGLGRKLELARLRGEPVAAAWGDADYRVYISGEVASSDIRGPGLVLYIPALDNRRILASRWQKHGGPDAPIVLRHTFWSAPDDGWTLPGAEPVRGLSTAPWPLVYADLMTSREPRAKVAAVDFLEQVWTSRSLS